MWSARLIILFVTLVATMALTPAEIEQKFKSSGLIPDEVDSAPKSPIKVSYRNKEVNFGSELTPLQVKDQPQVQWEADPGKFYTLAMVDPDAPSRKNPLRRSWNHWLVGNIQGDIVSTGNVITEYVGSGPPRGTGLHRYTFLVFEQKDKLKFDEPRTAQHSRADRANFSIRNFAKKYNLIGPIAGNFFVAQWDQYVEERNKHIV